MRDFAKTGEALEKKWRGAGYDEAVFPELAAEALGSSGLVGNVNLWDIAGWALEQTYLPEQWDLEGRFGDPPLTIFNAPRFHIDVYFWLEGTTSIHQHAFCGAFQVLEGSSIHSQYNFESEKELSSVARIGELELEKCELLSVGDIQKILPGQQYIHSLFHLEQPSATIVARTHRMPLELPQFSYFKPGYGIDSFFEEPNTTRKSQLLNSAFRSNYENAEELLRELLGRSDLQTSFSLLSNLRPILNKRGLEDLFGIRQIGERFDNVLKVVIDTHPEHGGVIKAVFENLRRVDTIVELRNIIADADHRFFLALLLNVEGRDRIFSLIKQRFPDDQPLDKALDWISELGNTRVLDGAFPNGLGIEGFTDFDTTVLEELLDGKSDDDITKEMISASGSAENMEEKVTESLSRLRDSAVLFALIQ